MNEQPKKKRQKKRKPVDPEARMTFTEHLAELRIRIIYSGIALIVGFIACVIFSETLYECVAGPLRDVDGVTWVTLTPLESFLVRIRLAAYAGIVLTAPFIIFQVCAFVFPGLKPNERKAIRILLTGGTLLMALGISVAYFGTLPLVLPYLMQYNPEGVSMLLSMKATVTLLIGLYLAFAVAFQFPLVALVLVYFDLLQPATLRAYRKPAIIVIALISAALTPPDPFTMLLMGAPMVLLYEVSIWVSYIVAYKRKAKEQEQEEEEPRKKSKRKPAKKTDDAAKPEDDSVAKLPEPGETVDDAPEQDETPAEGGAGEPDESQDSAGEDDGLPEHEDDTD